MSLSQEAANKLYRYNLQRVHNVKKRRREAGLCVGSQTCNLPLVSKQFCSYHLELNRANQERFRAGLSRKIAAAGELNPVAAMTAYVAQNKAAKAWYNRKRKQKAKARIDELL